MSIIKNLFRKKKEEEEEEGGRKINKVKGSVKQQHEITTWKLESKTVRK